MGDPKRLRKKYSTPMHPWSKETIEEERKLVQEYGLKRKREIFILDSFLKKYRNIAKRLIANKTAQGEKEKQQVLGKLQRLGLLSSEAKLDDILNLQLVDILERRIQSQVFRKGFARSMRQARQFITHGHVKCGNKSITSPSYLLTKEEENTLTFLEKSALSDDDHPERVSIAKEVKEEVEKVKGKEINIEAGKVKAEEKPVAKKERVAEKEAKKEETAKPTKEEKKEEKAEKKAKEEPAKEEKVGAPVKEPKAEEIKEQEDQVKGEELEGETPKEQIKEEKEFIKEEKEEVAEEKKAEEAPKEEEK